MTAVTAIRREDLAPAPTQGAQRHPAPADLRLGRRRQVDADRPPAVGRVRPLRRPARDASAARRTRRPAARIPISACCSTASSPSASRASPSTSPGAISIPPTRRFVIIDSPGHEQYTRNMASGASHADVAIMLVDARHGVKRQTRRHAAILDIVGVKRVVLAVNKMDLADWSQEKFRAIEADFRELHAALRLPRGDRHSGLGRRRRQRRAHAPSTCPGTPGRTCSSTSSASRRATSPRADRSACPCRPCCATASTSAVSPAPSSRAASASATASPTR